MDVSTKITRARADLAFDSPFFGSIAIRLKMVEKNDMPIKTMAVDGRNIFYDRDYVELLSLEELKGDIVHEVLHIAMLHHTRRGTRDPELWNIACDFAINPICKRNGFTMYEPTTLDEPRFHGMHAEDIYQVLLQEVGEKPQPCIMQAKDQIIEPQEEEARKEAEIEAKELQETASIAAKEAGKSPAGIDKLIQFLNEPEIRWQDQLRDYLNQRVKGRIQWHTPNRRLLDTVYLPHYSKEPAGRIAIFFDISSSMTVEEIKQCGAEVHAIALDNHITEIDVLYINTQVKKHQHFNIYDDFILDPFIGGGTSFEPGFDWLAKRDIQPSAVVYFTDGEAYFDFDPPQYPVVWCMTRNIIAPWGRTVALTNLRNKY